VLVGPGGVLGAALAVEAQLLVLRAASDHGERVDVASRSQDGVAFDDDVGPQAAAVAEADPRADDAAGTEHDALAEVGAVGHEGGRMDSGSLQQRSLFSERGLLVRATER